MKCEMCRRLVTQKEADEADGSLKVTFCGHPHGYGTMCVECAESTIRQLADGHEGARFEDEGEAAYGSED